MNNKIFLTVFALILVVMVAFASVAISNKDDSKNEAIEPLVTTAMSLGPPAGAVEQGSVTRASDPPTAVRVWVSDGSVDDACTKWRDTFRTWMGEANVGTVTGDVFPGQSCTFQGKKDGHAAQLIVAIYADNKPTASLNVTQ